jgi:hypothetical protein
MVAEEEGLGKDLLKDISTEALEQELLSRQRNLLTDLPAQALERELRQRRMHPTFLEARPSSEPLRHEVRK